MGPCPISYESIEAYARLHGLTLRAWEIEGIRRIDNAYLRTQADS